MIILTSLLNQTCQSPWLLNNTFIKTAKYCYSSWVTKLSSSTSWLSSTANLIYQQCFETALNSIYLAGDVERNPGPRPPRFPCGSCQKACSSYRGAKASILCDSCETWFHSDCVGLSDSALNTLGRSDLPWECYNCGLPNLSTGLFDSTILDSSGAESHLSCGSASTSSTSSHPGSPLAQSSPTKSDRHSVPSLHNLRYLEINFQSIYSKRAEFWSLIDAIKPDVIYGCETWLKPNISQGEIFPPGYDVYRRDRKDGWGGVLLGIHSSLNSYQIDIETNAEFVAAKIVNGNQNIIVAALYRTPVNDDNYMKELTSTISNLCQSNPGAAIWISGDANLPDIEWSTHSIRPSPRYKISINEAFIDLLDRTGLEQVIDFPTRGENILNIMLTNRPSLVNSSSGLPALSDHDVVFAEINARAIRKKPVSRKILLWNRADLQVIRSRVSQLSLDYTSKFSTSTPVNILADTLQNDLEEVIADCVPSKLSSTRPNQPWFNSATKRAIRRKSRAFRKARRTNKERDWTRFKRLKKETQKTCRKAYNKFTYDIIHSDPGSKRNKRLGALIKSKRCDNIGVSPLKDQGFLHSDPKTKANILNKQFTSVFSVDDGSPLPDLPDDHHPTMDNITVCQNGVIKLLRNLKPFTASGPDGIPTKLLKETAVEISPAITLLFQASIDQGRVPPQWKKAHIVPIYKKGSRSSPANYRPISLTSVLCKLCEHILHCAIIRHLSDHEILSDAQHGFRKRRSCDTQLIVTLEDLAKGLDNKSQTDVVLLDYEKAFDKVSHRHLLSKVKHYGIQGSSFQWISDFLHSRSQVVLVDGQKSVESNVTSGVPQGSVLGPLLFLIFINDLPQSVSTATTRLFADDSVVYNQISSSADSVNLQKDLDALQDWEAKWLMRFNASKCQVLQITNKRKPIPATYTIHGQVLEVVDSAKYLGVHLDTHLNFNTHVDAITKRANGTRAFLSRNLSHCSQKVKEAAYTMFVRPSVEFASSAWDPHTRRNIQKLEQVQRSSARFVVGDYQRTSSVSDMISSLNWPSLQDRRLNSRLVMMYKIYYNLVDIDWKKHLTLHSSTTRGHSSRFFIPHTSSSAYTSSFFPRTIRNWNNLPVDPAAYPSLDAFKSALRVPGLK